MVQNRDRLLGAALGVLLAVLAGPAVVHAHPDHDQDSPSHEHAPEAGPASPDAGATPALFPPAPFMPPAGRAWLFYSRESEGAADLLLAVRRICRARAVELLEFDLADREPFLRLVDIERRRGIRWQADTAFFVGARYLAGRPRILEFLDAWERGEATLDHPADEGTVPLPTQPPLPAVQAPLPAAGAGEPIASAGVPAVLAEAGAGGSGLQGTAEILAAPPASLSGRSRPALAWPRFRYTVAAAVALAALALGVVLGRRSGRPA